MEKDYLLTIAVPTYNGEKTIQNLLALLLPQCVNDIELLISDNCSTDGTRDIIREYKKKYQFIKYIRNEKNIGPDANFLQCMEKAQGHFIWLISDDDIVAEGAITQITRFLAANKNISLIYVTTRDFRGKYTGIENCSKHKPEVEVDIVTHSKKTFVKYAGYYWGFMSSFICNSERFNKIKNPERYFGTYWLQSYIHALCASGDSMIGIIKAPCVGAGIYINTSNFDSALVNGIYYKKMLNTMVQEAGFDRKQLDRLYIHRLLHLLRHDIVKEKASGKKRINKKNLFKSTRNYPKAWLTVYPLMLIPNLICRIAVESYREKLHIEGKIRVNRPE